MKISVDVLFKIKQLSLRSCNVFTAINVYNTSVKSFKTCKLNTNTSVENYQGNLEVFHLNYVQLKR